MKNIKAVWEKYGQGIVVLGAFLTIVWLKVPMYLADVVAKWLNEVLISAGVDTSRQLGPTEFAVTMATVLAGIIVCCIMFGGDNTVKEKQVKRIKH